MNASQLPSTAMNIPEHFEFHYVQNGVKKSVTLFTGTLFRQPTNELPEQQPSLHPPRPTRQEQVRRGHPHGPLPG